MTGRIRTGRCPDNVRDGQNAKAFSVGCRLKMWVAFLLMSLSFCCGSPVSQENGSDVPRPLDGTARLILDGGFDSGLGQDWLHTGNDGHENLMRYKRAVRDLILRHSGLGMPILKYS